MIAALHRGACAHRKRIFASALALASATSMTASYVGGVKLCGGINKS